jgi:geranylgeranyl diphosphate synthase type II
VRAGALACGRDPDTWDELGDCLGLAYQAADDIRDVIADPQWLGKPGGQDALLGRPNVMHELGLTDGLAYFNQLMDRAVASVPACPCRELLQQLVRLESQRLIPAELIDHARHLPIWASSPERGSRHASLGMRSA